MKLCHQDSYRLGLGSPPVRGAWIEMSLAQELSGILGSPPVRGAWIEISHKNSKKRTIASRPP